MSNDTPSTAGDAKTLFANKDTARRIAKRNEAFDGDWHYAVVPVGDRFAIAVRDEEKNFMGYL